MRVILHVSSRLAGVAIRSLRMIESTLRRCGNVVCWNGVRSRFPDAEPRSDRPVDLKSVLAEVDSWPVEDRIRLVHELWERLAVEGNDLELSDAAKAEIDRRLAAHASEPEAAISWEEVEADALSRIRR